MQNGTPKGMPPHINLQSNWGKLLRATVECNMPGGGSSTLPQTSRHTTTVQTTPSPTFRPTLRSGSCPSAANSSERTAAWSPTQEGSAVQLGKQTAHKHWPPSPVWQREGTPKPCSEGPHLHLGAGLLIQCRLSL